MKRHSKTILATSFEWTIFFFNGRHLKLLPSKIWWLCHRCCFMNVWFWDCWTIWRTSENFIRICMTCINWRRWTIIIARLWATHFEETVLNQFEILLVFYLRISLFFASFVASAMRFSNLNEVHKKAHCILLIRINVIRSNCLNASLGIDRTLQCFLFSLSVT